MIRSIMCALFVLISSNSVFAEGDPASGKKLIKKWDCKFCHGISGNTRGTEDQPIPVLAAQPAEDLLRALKEYKSGVRKDIDTWSNMSRKVVPLTEQDMKDIAAHYASQKRF